MKTAQPSFSKLISGSFTWLLPASLIIVTFLMLFFVLSERVSTMRHQMRYMNADIKKLRSELNTYTGKKGENADTPKDSQKATYMTETISVSNVKVNKVYIDLTSSYYWGYSFESTYELKLSYENSVAVENNVVSVYSYTTNNKQAVVGGSKEMKLLELNSSEDKIVINKDLMSGSLLVFVDNELVIFNDFSGKDLITRKDALEFVKNDLNTPNDLKEAINTELSKLN